MNQPRFLTHELVHQIHETFGKPVYVYSEKELEDRAQEFLYFPHAYGVTVRYAMKANSNRNIITLFSQRGIGIEASSEFEALRALAIGVPGKRIQLSSQEYPYDVQALLRQEVFFIATSLYQLEQFGKDNLGGELGVRINPGVGSAAFQQINAGGWTSSFGVWHEYIKEVKEIANKYHLKITKVHIHIGSENTPASWVESASIGLSFVQELPDVHTLDLGGGFKMAIMPYEKSADLQEIGLAVKARFEAFYQQTGRRIHLEVEPGKYLTINTCSFVARVIDIVDTGASGHVFLRTNSGMNDMPRVPMHGVQEPIFVMSNETEMCEYIVVGHCCESSDLITCKLYDQETIEARLLPKANIGDMLVIDGVGSYNASMAMKNYNSFPESAELLLRKSGEIVEMRARQRLEDIWRNEREVV